MADELPLLFDEIRELMEESADDPSAPLLARMEHTLTDGYARALALEGERWRIEKRIGELARRIHAPEEAREMRTLAVSLRSAEGDLVRLRGLLELLRERVEAVRSAGFEASSPEASLGPA